MTLLTFWVMRVRAEGLDSFAVYISLSSMASKELATCCLREDGRRMDGLRMLGVRFMV